MNENKSSPLFIQITVSLAHFPQLKQLPISASNRDIPVNGDCWGAAMAFLY